MGGVVLDGFEETGLLEAQIQCGELSGEKLDDLVDWWWWEEEGVNTVDDAVSSELRVC